MLANEFGSRERRAVRQFRQNEGLVLIFPKSQLRELPMSELNIISHESCKNCGKIIDTSISVAKCPVCKEPLVQPKRPYVFSQIEYIGLTIILVIAAAVAGRFLGYLGGSSENSKRRDIASYNLQIESPSGAKYPVRAVVGPSGNIEGYEFQDGSVLTLSTCEPNSFCRDSSGRLWVLPKQR